MGRCNARFVFLASWLLLVSRAGADSPPAAGYPAIHTVDAVGHNLFIGGSNFGVAATPVVKWPERA